MVDSYAWFKDMVKNRRQLEDEALDRVDDGRVFTGRQGVGLKLVDEIGKEKTAIGMAGQGKEDHRPRRRCAITR